MPSEKLILNVQYSHKCVGQLRPSRQGGGSPRSHGLSNEGGEGETDTGCNGIHSILHTWSQSLDRNAPVKALGLLEIMIRLHKAGGGVGDDDEDEDDDLDPHLSAAAANKDIPDVTSFSTVINAFSKSRYPRKARQARDLLRRMKHLHEHGSGGGGSGRKKRKNEALRPSNNHVFVYAAVLNACAYTFGTNEVKDEALKIGIDTYEELQRSADIRGGSGPHSGKEGSSRMRSGGGTTDGGGGGHHLPERQRRWIPTRPPSRQVCRGGSRGRWRCRAGDRGCASTSASRLCRQRREGARAEGLCSHRVNGCRNPSR